MQNEEGQQKFGPKEFAIIGGTIIAVLIAGFVIFKFLTADTPYAVNTPPVNTGTSEKALAMKEQAGAKAAGAAAPVAPGGDGGGGVGDDVDPRKYTKK